MANPNNVAKMPNLGTRMLSVLLQRMGLGQHLGMQFGGLRRLYEVFGYAQTLRYEDYAARYTRQGLARRIVNAFPQSTWGFAPEVKGGDGFDTVFAELVIKHKLWSMLENADRLSRIGHYSIVLMGVGDSGAFSSPVALKERKLEDLLYLQAYSEQAATIDLYVTDPTDPRFGKPAMYSIQLVDPSSRNTVTPSSVTTKSVGNSFPVHHSRVIHIAEDAIEDGVIGTPALQPVYNDLDDLLKVSGGTAETYWITANRGMHIDVDKEMEFTKADAEGLTDELQEFTHNLTRFIRTRGVKIDALGADYPAPGETYDMIISLLSGSTGIPRRILTGAEAGHLASEQDRANWADRIDERRRQHAEPNILRPIIGKLADFGVIPQPANLEITWPRAMSLSPLEEAQRMAQQARAAINLSRQSEKGFPITTLKEARKIIGLKPDLDAGDTLPEPPPPAGAQDPNNPDDTQDEDNPAFNRTQKQEN